MTFSYQASGACAKLISFDITDGKLHNVQFMGGCMGNLRAISKLIEGKSAKDVADILRGNTCGGKSTSCADQLARAIDEALKA